MPHHSLKPAIGPSLLTFDFARLQEEVAKKVTPFLQKEDYVHMDVMDGNFVNDITFSSATIKGLRKYTDAIFSVHLMVSKPANIVKSMADAGVNRLTFHLESVQENEVQALIDSIKAAKMEVGIAINPETPLERVLPYCNQLDMVLVMTVVPGSCGMAFMEDQVEKVARLRKDFPDLDIEVEGDVTGRTIDMCAKAGANWVVSGDYIEKDPARNIAILRRSVQKYGNGIPDEELFPLPPASKPVWCRV